MQAITISKFKQLISLFKPKQPFLSLSSSPTSLPAISTPTHPIPQSLFRSLKRRPPLPELRRLHARLLSLAVSSHPSFATSLINCYLSVNDFNSARKIFDRYRSSSPPPTLVWNLMIRAYSKLGDSHEAVFLFGKMLALDRGFRVFPDGYTLTFALASCSSRVSLECGESVHGLAVKFGFDSDLFVGNSMVNMYGVLGDLGSAQRVFDEMSERDVFAWTGLLKGYARSGEIGRACEVFEEMPVRNEVSWAVMISGFVGCEMYVEGLSSFRDMLCEGKVKPNEAILVSVLSCAAHLGALDQGSWIHSYIDTNGLEFSGNVATALIDMYGKCGRIDRAKQVFSRTSRRDVFSYTSMISGLSVHGLGKEAVRVFSLMLEENVVPNDITILGLLNGCSHSGLVDEGFSIFSEMESSWGIVPKIEHYGCYIDLLGRAGFLESAFEVAKSMPMRPDVVIWRALLSACRIHRDVKLGEDIAKHIEQLDIIEHSEGKALLSNLNACLGKWERVAELRDQIYGKRNRSSRGCSWIEVNGIVHEFRVDDQMHPQIAKIQEKLREVLRRASLGGYVAITRQVLFDLSEEDKEHAIAFHSEKLAVTFGLMSTEPGTPIWIVKNLRTCEDCHLALKAISLVYKRELIVRDRSRFHTIKDGVCLCNDYW